LSSLFRLLLEIEQKNRKRVIKFCHILMSHASRMQKVNLMNHMMALMVLSVTYFNKIPLNAIPIGTPSEKHKLTIPMRSVRSSSVVMSAM
jgi:hypothetical protein